MPELPEVETVRKGLAKKLLGGKIAHIELRREGLRFPFPKGFKQGLEGRIIEQIDRRAKYLQFRLDGQLTWLVHLGMTGKFTLYSKNEAPMEYGKHDHVIVTMEDGGVAIYTDHRRFGYMDLIATDEEANHRFFANLGCEPLSDDFDARALCKSLLGKKSPIKTALLDQRVVAGLGNIYVCEILFRAGVSPRRVSSSIAGKGTLVTKRAERLVDETKQVLIEAIEAGGSTISDFAAVDGDLGYFAHSFRVYGREGQSCHNSQCPGIVSRISQGGRSTFFCPKCQR
ncbi:MAG TPA: bifunctional DNA-formamidopyrimidine glycosylase/DNA-(apurinic or apyrimidinic site) lyase [Candidatus Thalassarchaeaceae archaeon]|nr:bifunctional DNA-formamidopyrimidine glycosylase/DNA-(apurinic or apyrimidinic site) lyase [Candidatus Thalassarchaeaceae archaeon]